MATIQFENIKHGDWIILNEDDEKSKHIAFQNSRLIDFS